MKKKKYIYEKLVNLHTNNTSEQNNLHKNK